MQQYSPAGQRKLKKITKFYCISDDLYLNKPYFLDQLL